VAVLFVAGASSAIAADLPDDLARAAKEYDRANVASDLTALERLFADDYVLVNSDASVENKQQAIADFRMPGFRIDPYVVTQPVQTAWSEGAVIGGVVHLGWTQDGKHQQRWIRIAHVWAKRHGHWQMVYTQVTRVPQ
jgi:ketosteroid isomerase-like protein